MDIHKETLKAAAHMGATSDDTLIEQLCMPADWTHPLDFMMVSEDKLGNDEVPELLDLMSISETSYKGPYKHYFPSKYKFRYGS
jgi:hypothetical protein